MIEKAKGHLRRMLQMDGSPHRASLAFAIGVFIAFGPHLGLHTLSAIGLAWAFRLNLPIMLFGAFLNNPWTLVPIYGFCLCLGNYMLGEGFQCLPAELSTPEVVEFLKDSPLPFVAGTLVTGAAASIVSYFVLKRILLEMHFKGKQGTMKSL